MILFIDTETTGLFREGVPLDAAIQPWPVEMAGLLTRQDGQTVSAFHAVIKPDGWVVPEKTRRINGISHDYAMAYGLPLADVMVVVEVFAESADLVVAYNMTFDGGIVEAACARRKLKSPLEGKRLACASRMALEHFGGYRRKQSEVYEKLFGKPLEDARSAWADCRACRDIYIELAPKFT